VKKQHGFFHEKRPEQNISLRRSRFGGTYEHIRCLDAKKYSCQCSIKIVRTKNDVGKDERSIYIIADHNHDRMSIPRAVLDDGMKKKVEALYKSGYSRLVYINTFTQLRRFLLSTPFPRRCANTSSLTRNADVLQKGKER